MGLDTSHNAWHGSYSTFMRFRKCLAAQIGIDLMDYAGYNEGGTKDLQSIDHKLMPLFNHSDCDGELSVEESQNIADGLNQVLENFDESKPHDFDFKDRIIQFRDGCLLAVSKNEIIDFH